MNWMEKTLALLVVAALPAQDMVTDARAEAPAFPANPAFAAALFTPFDFEQDSQEDRYYERGTSALQENRWDRAVEAFSEAVKLGGRRVDGALYWKAYAQNKQGQRAEALTTLGQLMKDFPGSRWLNEAKVLEIEIRQASGQSVAPERESDEELKLVAINALLNTDAERAVPMLEKLLQGNQSPKLKERALFVLTQSNSPRAREVVAQFARGSSNPDLQMKALNYLGIYGNKENRQLLAEIYASSSDREVKRRILHSFMVSRDRERLLAAAKGEASPELRAEAIHLLGVMGARTELSELYQAESSVEVKEKILHAMFISGNAERLIEVARSEKEPKLRLRAIHSLGIMGQPRTGDTLVSLYDAEKDTAVRKAVIQGLFIQGNASGLISLAKKETDMELKKEIVGKLSLIKSKEAVDYLMEILK
jgi:HEAT repeat protein